MTRVALAAALSLPLATAAEPMKPGEFWYRIDDKAGKPQGYTRMVVTAVDGGGTRVEWEMKFAWTGGNYEETRAAEFDKDRRLVSASGGRFGVTLGEGKRDGAKFVGRTRGDADAAWKDGAVEMKDPSMSELGFALAATMPLKLGETFAYEQVSEMDSLQLRQTTLTCEAEEVVEGIKSWRFTRKYKDDKGPGVRIWVSDDRRMVKADWNGIVQTISASSTKDLYKPKPPAFAETKASTKEWLELEGVIPAAPEVVFDWWTKGELLTKWWPPEASVELKEGGKYELTWKAQKWTLQGTVKSFERGKSFVFTWRWNFDAPEIATQEVHVAFAAEGKGTKLVIRHGPYKDTPDDQGGRKGHIRGWNQFGGRLVEEIVK
ncbi:MAG: hypothetical protein FD180_4046 [Planctomycetota bacterium]|nr:MAG: hypothetical protein FD180_4046 [Planctomycetota bacterium]